MLLKIFITILIVLKNQKEPLTATQIALKYHSDYHSDSRERCNKHQKILEVLARAIRFHERQDLALRENRETLKESDEYQDLGSFLSYLIELQFYYQKFYYQQFYYQSTTRQRCIPTNY